MMHVDINKSHVNKIILHMLTKYILHVRDRDMPQYKEYANIYRENHCYGTLPNI